MFRLYNHNIMNYNPPEDRNHLINSLINEFDADVCTFQECSPFTNRLGKAPIQDLLSDRYTEAGTGMDDYTPVFYKTEKFNLIDEGYLLFDGLNDGNSKSVTWVILEDNETKKRFSVMATHFWWQFTGDADNLQRIENARQLKKLCEEIVSKYNVPIIIGGDFNNGKNSLQGDAPYYFMLENGFKDVSLTSPESIIGHTCRKKYTLSEGDKAYIVGGDADMTIDYIFTYGDGIKPLSFKVDSSQRAKCSSDHLPLLALFEVI